MTPASKSIRGPRGRSYKTSEEERRAAALARVRLYTYESTGSRSARGRLDQLIDAGHVPQGIAIDEAARQPVEWSDLEGRAAVIRPYARHQWEVRIFHLPHEAQEAKQREIERHKAWRQEHERDREHNDRRRRLEARATGFPESLSSYRTDTISVAHTMLDTIERLVTGAQFDGCSLDEDSQDEVRAGISSIKTALASATYYYNSGERDRRRRELHRFDAQNDDQLQALLRQVGAK
ncbi:MAG: hypothetical protein ING59_12520 [Burkholderiales bacterium]|jgi:hypothetical protein|nr:hypothetical protein [Burkholderiales bacterium]